MRGFVNIYKPSGMTSSDVVVKVRGILRRATGVKQKTGHLGTLDPLATGVLPIAIGTATRLFDYMQTKIKTYISTFKFGETTATLDKGSEIIAADDISLNKDDIVRILPSLIGEIDQIPPQYSAKSIGGRRAYDIARQGGTAELKPKTVNIYSIELIGEPNSVICIDNTELLLEDNQFAFKIVCGSGTYIRAIARDMAQMLNTVGYMTSLCRVQSGDFAIDNAVTLRQFERDPHKFILPIETALKDYDTLELDDSDAQKALNGVKIRCDRAAKSPFLISIASETVGIGEVDGGYMRIKTRL